VTSTEVRVPLLSIRPAALGDWCSLLAALRERGPAPCETSPETWWSTAATVVEAAVYGCRRCPVQVECLAYAVAAGERQGTWGGVTERERQAASIGGST